MLMLLMKCEFRQWAYLRRRPGLVFCPTCGVGPIKGLGQSEALSPLMCRLEVKAVSLGPKEKKLEKVD